MTSEDGGRMSHPLISPRCSECAKEHAASKGALLTLSYGGGYAFVHDAKLAEVVLACLDVNQLQGVLDSDIRLLIADNFFKIFRTSKPW